MQVMPICTLSQFLAGKNATSCDVQHTLRIAIILGRVGYGGAEVMVMNYLRRLPMRANFDVFSEDCSRLPYKSECESENVRFYDTPCIAKVLRYHEFLFRHFRLNRYDIVHSNISTLSVFPLLAALRAGVPARICHNHSTAHWGEGAKTLFKYMLRPFARALSTVCCACGSHAGQWMSGAPTVFNRSPTVIVPNGIDPTAFAFSPKAREDLRKELGIGENTFILGHVGRFVFQKNHTYLLKIFAALRHRRADVALLLIGSGALENAIQKQVQRMGLDRAVRFLGARSDMPRLYSAMDAFALPSFYEGVPVVGLEAQANGLPCFFSSKVSGEVLLLPQSKRLNLCQRPEVWAKAISEGRRESIPLPDEYDINKQAQSLADFYACIASDVRPKH